VNPISFATVPSHGLDPAHTTPLAAPSEVPNPDTRPSLDELDRECDTEFKGKSIMEPGLTRPAVTHHTVMPRIRLTQSSPVQTSIALASNKDWPREGAIHIRSDVAGPALPLGPSSPLGRDRTDSTSYLPFHHHGATALGRERTGRTRDKSSSRPTSFPRRINRYVAATIDKVTCRYHARYPRT